MDRIKLAWAILTGREVYGIMAVIYASLIISGNKTFAQVPKTLKENVSKADADKIIEDIKAAGGEASKK